MSEVEDTIKAEAPDAEKYDLWLSTETIYENFKRQTRIQNLTTDETITIETSNGQTITATVTETPDDPTTGNPTFTLDVDAITGTRHPDDEIILTIDREGATGSFGDWQDVPYLTVLPKDAGKPSYGDITSLTV